MPAYRQLPTRCHAVSIGVGPRALPMRAAFRSGRNLAGMTTDAAVATIYHNAH